MGKIYTNTDIVYFNKITLEMKYCADGDLITQGTNPCGLVRRISCMSPLMSLYTMFVILWLVYSDSSGEMYDRQITSLSC